MTCKPYSRGFSLIELLVTLSIVGILASVAYPSYRNSLQASSRAEAQAALAGLAAAMEQHYTTKNSYVGAANGETPTIYPSAVPLDVSNASKQTYDLRISAADSSSFRISAVPKNSQKDDKCGTLTLNQAFQRGISGAQSGLTAEDCWKK